MYLYKKSMLDKFKFPFDGIEYVKQSYSQLLQDMFVLAVTNGKREGTFLEIGAYHPSFISNTFLLESLFLWSGVSVDIDPSTENLFKMSGRKTHFYTANALELDYMSVLIDNFSEDRVDYLSLDIEPNINTLNCLKRLPLDKYRFTCITFESDWYDTNSPKEQNDFVRSESRKILNDLDYVLVAGNIANMTTNFVMEDWYVDGRFVPNAVIEYLRRQSDDPIPAHEYMGLSL